MASTEAPPISTRAPVEAPAPAVKFLFAGTSFLSAFLLFQVQLIVNKHILPWFGGSAAVWMISMLVFQLLLLAGYVYSHFVSQSLSVGAQTRIHGLLLGTVSLLMIVLMFRWPSAITPAESWKPSCTGSPVLEVVLILLVSAGLPFFALSTTAPLLQHWFATLGVGHKTYKLYSVSNLGSLLGLLTFPFLLEPAFRMRTQSFTGCLLFFVFAIGCGLCAWQARTTRGETIGSESGPPEARSAGPAPLTWGLWVLLPACASALLFATTNLLCQEVTSVPLLWVLPLTIYLLSFILSFDHLRWYQRSLFHPLFVIGVFLTCAALIYDRPIVQLASLPVLLFVACMICHGELVRLRPSVQHLTGFYLAVSAGGAAGGVFVAIVAPHVFTFFTEFQVSLMAVLALSLVCLFRERTSWIYCADVWLPLAITMGTILLAYAMGREWAEIAAFLERTRFYPVVLLLAFLVILGALAFRGSHREKSGGFRFVQVLVIAFTLGGILALARSTEPLPGLYLSVRNFYGAVRVFNVPHGKMLMHGRTIHGGQFEPPVDKEPATYYGRQSGIGVLMENHPHRTIGDGTLRVGIIGLGAGTLAAYGRHGDKFRYYEINPYVVDLSSQPHPVFTYIADSPADVELVTGDARLQLERETARGTNHRFDILVVDAFSGDAIPVHLLTREAFDTYWSQVDLGNGVIAIHLSSRHVDLLPVVLGAAEYSRANSLVHYEEGKGPFLSNCWVLLARQGAVLGSLGLNQVFPPDRTDRSPRLWSDDYSDIFRLIR